MRRRLALQILASSAFGSAVITAVPSESNDLNQSHRDSTAELLSALSNLHQDASLYLRDVSADELRVITTDVAFFAQEAHARASSDSFDTPAFWQSCHDRFLTAKVTLTSSHSGRTLKTRMIQTLDRCLPLLQKTLERTLA